MRIVVATAMATKTKTCRANVGRSSRSAPAYVATMNAGKNALSDMSMPV
jgi:hypothetical protein